MPVWWVSGESLFLACRRLASGCDLTWPFPCALMEREKLSSLVSLLVRTRFYQIRAPPLWLYLTLITSLEALRVVTHSHISHSDKIRFRERLKSTGQAERDKEKLMDSYSLFARVPEAQRLHCSVPIQSFLGFHGTIKNLFAKANQSYVIAISKIILV